MDRSAQERAEQLFWDEHVPSLAECLDEYRAGPDPNTEFMLRSLEPIDGARVLDFACGAGVMSVWLAERGAAVTGVDISPASTARAAELARAIGVSARFVTGRIGSVEIEPPLFDRIAGRYALHHVDAAVTAPSLARHLRAGGIAAFLETMASNPVLRLARRHIVGRFGVPRFGTTDEHPLTNADLELYSRELGELTIAVAQMSFLRMFDRQILQHRSKVASTILGFVDDLLLTRLGWRSGSYHQVLIFKRPDLSAPRAEASRAG